MVNHTSCGLSLCLPPQTTQGKTPGSFLRGPKPEGLRHQRLGPHVQIDSQASIQPPVPKGRPLPVYSQSRPYPHCDQSHLHMYNTSLKAERLTGWCMMCILIISPLAEGFVHIWHWARRASAQIIVWNKYIMCFRGGEKNLLVIFTVTDSCDELQIGNSNPKPVTDPELTMQAQQQYTSMKDIFSYWHAFCKIFIFQLV